MLRQPIHSRVVIVTDPSYDLKKLQEDHPKTDLLALLSRNVEPWKTPVGSHIYTEFLHMQASEETNSSTRSPPLYIAMRALPSGSPSSLRHAFKARLFFRHISQ